MRLGEECAEPHRNRNSEIKTVKSKERGRLMRDKKGAEAFKKIISFMTVISVIGSLFCLPAFAADEDISIILNGESPDMSEIRASVGDKITSPSVKEVGGSTVWHVGSTTWSDENLYLDIDDSLAAKFADAEDVYVEVEYYAVPRNGSTSAFFELKYINADNVEQRSETIFSTGENEFKTASLKLPAARLNNGFMSGSTKYDLVLTTRSWKYGYSGLGVQIKKVSVKHGGTSTKVRAYVETDKVGNIMLDTDENATFRCTLKNDTELEKTISCVLNIKDDDGRVISSSEKSVRAEAEAETAFYIDYASRIYGAYTAELVANDGENSSRSSCGFSYVRGCTEKNDRMGTCVHLGGAERDPVKTLKLVSDAGIGYIRTEMNWNKYEAQKGVYELSVYQRRCLAEARKNGVKLLVVLGLGNELYSASENTIPKTDEEKTAFYNYVYHLTKELEHDYGDVVAAYELWNEPNHPSFNKDMAASGSDYASLAKTVRDALNAASAKCPLIGLSMTGVHDSDYFKWCEDAYKAGLGKYVDGMSFHPYWSGLSPETYDMTAKMNKMHGLADTYGGLRKLWTTEHGYTTIKDYISEEIQAQRLIRSYLISVSDPDFEKYFIYQLQDGGNNPYDAEHQWGLIRCWRNIETPYQAKQSYTAVAALNYLLDGFKYESHDSETDYERYCFKNSETGERLYAVYNKDEKVKTYTPDKAGDGYEIKIYDTVGNELKAGESISINGNPKYVMYKKIQNPQEPVSSIEQKEKYGKITLSGHKDNEKQVQLIILKAGKTYDDFIGNPSGSIAYFNTVNADNGNFNDEFYIHNFSGEMTVVLKYMSDGTYEYKSFNAESRLVLKYDGGKITVSKYDGEGYDAYYAEYSGESLLNSGILKGSSETFAAKAETDRVRAFLWNDALSPTCPAEEISLGSGVEYAEARGGTAQLNLSGKASGKTVGVTVRKNNSSGEIVYFNEFPIKDGEYRAAFEFEGESGTYSVTVGGESGFILRNILLTYIFEQK